MTAGAGKPDGVLAFVQLFERLALIGVFVHRLDLPVTGDAAFELRGLSCLILGCSSDSGS